MNGWITEVDNGLVWGRIFINDEQMEFSMPILSVLECQRVELEPCRYCSFVNGHLLIDKTIWTTHDVETADRAAHRLYRDLGWNLDAQEPHTPLKDNRTGEASAPRDIVNIKSPDPGTVAVTSTHHHTPAE